MSQLTNDELIQIRRHLHQIPELAMHEVQTRDYLIEVISQMNLEYAEIRDQIATLPTAILVRVNGSDPLRTIGYRTDIDALPVDEQTGLAYASQHPHVMHACGHDVHMTVALGVLNHFLEHRPKDNLVFFFQPAEESQNGGKVAFEQGLFEGKWRPDEFYGLHDNPDLPAGSIGCRMGTLFAGTTEVNVDFRGKSGHAAFPQDANDMVVAASQFINQVQTIISRSINPIESGVITFGLMQAGTIRNVISGSARLEGTIRGLTQVMIERIIERLKQVAAGIASSYDCDVDIQFNQGGYLPVENNPELTKRLIDFFTQDDGTQFIETEPAMTGEDFGYLLAKFPGTMFWLGVNDDSQLHSATFKPDEAAISKGISSINSFLEYRMTN
ncbi:N-acetyldiaminopimelate deacetylase [Lentilactobacillus sp. SPB1-3]|uniref:N-acetyldiaminopimelate deacetylase n=1 Tax=Lentilactobacillus terminaliae TaxID=3003483 RepID=A0ACD5DFV7_9LACO|nr:N-acetyldiaminopimelate deacetylase [Lentilactobacillus sp. SPB1-3]MCZ0976546.1 N-acetyldiaminopimelate deacetylase [Lentilactobacillus sp. SPB1-3]